MQYRDYQAELDRKIFEEWDKGAQCVAAESPTGSGKTVLFSNIIKKVNKPTVAIAHRQELVTQISMALARNGLQHGLVANKDVIRLCNKMHLNELGKTFYNANAPVKVASINTLTSKKTMPLVQRWAHNVGLWVMDEGHHLLRDNMWGRGVDLFTNARGLGVSAWFGRSDGMGLGSHDDGFYDTIVRGPSMGDLIQRGYLSQFKTFGPHTDINTEGLKLNKEGDYNFRSGEGLKRVDKVRSTITGDIVEHYLKLAPGKLGVTFVTDVTTARETALRFNLAGVKAVAIDGSTPANERAEYLRQFAKREILQIVNVDIFGEGFDCPAIEVVQFARPTASYSLYIQQFGRALRILEGKDYAIIIDHVSNIIKHGGPPIILKPSGLDRREKRNVSKKDPNELKLKACKKCLGHYESIMIECPYCGYEYIPEDRSLPEFVDGDLVLLDEFMIDNIKADIESAKAPPKPCGNPSYDRVNHKKYIQKMEVREELENTIAEWAGRKRDEGYSKRERQKMFYLMFRVDVLSAQALDKSESKKLNEMIRGVM